MRLPIRSRYFRDWARRHAQSRNHPRRCLNGLLGNVNTHGFRNSRLGGRGGMKNGIGVIERDVPLDGMVYDAGGCYIDPSIFENGACDEDCLGCLLAALEKSRR